MKPREQIKKDIYWLAGILVFSILLSVSSIYKGFITGNFNIDIRLHDTYIVAPPYFFPTLIFLLLGSFTFFLRQIVLKFRNAGTNIILMILMTVLMMFTISTSVLIFELSKMPSYKGGWTVYAPLSAIPNGNIEYKYSSLFRIWLMFQTIVILSCVFISYRTGRTVSIKKKVFIEDNTKTIN